MSRHLTAKIYKSFLFAVGLFLTCAFQINAQQNSQPIAKPAQPAENVKSDDVSITANVTAKELKFEVVPNPTVEFFGKPERETVWEADRQNLPKPVQPGVTYRNIGIQLRITSRFADIDRIVSEALGEIPITDDAPTANQQTQKPNANDSTKQNNQTPTAQTSRQKPTNQNATRKPKL